MRKTDYDKLDRMFIDRWSPRAFVTDAIAEEDIMTLFEAARWSPSCFNEQPWRFVYARKPEDIERFCAALTEKNRLWACKAPLLVLVFSKKTFTQSGKHNRWANFDTGAAWMAFTLQANRLGLYTHGMAGFSAEKAYEVTGMDPAEYDAICAVAVGKVGDPQSLPEDLRNRETPNDRKAISELVFEGSIR